MFISIAGDGHGTHVAGTAAGKTYGVAKKASIHSIRVLDDEGFGTSASILAGLDFILPRCPVQKPVINLSLGAEFSAFGNQVMHIFEAAGCTIVVAAGNEEQDACNTSPASSSAVITVGATNITDERAWFSNFGSCTDIYAPGVDIVSASIYGGPSGNIAMSGTSMASPLFAGICALYLEKGWSCRDAVAAGVPGQLMDANPDILAQVSPLLTDTQPTRSGPLGMGCTTEAGASGSIAYMGLFTDAYPQETSWEILDSSGQMIASRTAGYYTSDNTFTQEEVCVPSGPLTVKFADSGDDGICCGFGVGSFKFTVDDYETYAFGYSFESVLSLDLPRDGSGPIIILDAPIFEESKPGDPNSLGNECTSKDTGLPGVTAILELLTDEYPDETSWEVRDASNTTVAASAVVYRSPSTLYFEEVCVPSTGDLSFIIYDTACDGICCDCK